jgi:hypothetical protein
MADATDRKLDGIDKRLDGIGDRLNITAENIATIKTDIATIKTSVGSHEKIASLIVIGFGIALAFVVYSVIPSQISSAEKEINERVPADLKTQLGKLQETIDLLLQGKIKGISKESQRAWSIVARIEKVYRNAGCYR